MRAIADRVGKRQLLERAFDTGGRPLAAFPSDPKQRLAGFKALILRPKLVMVQGSGLGTAVQSPGKQRHVSNKNKTEW